MVNRTRRGKLCTVLKRQPRNDGSFDLILFMCGFHAISPSQILDFRLPHINIPTLLSDTQHKNVNRPRRLLL